MQQALSFYRAIYRTAGLMPSKDRTRFVRRRLRAEYEKYRHETSPERVAFLLQVADTQLDTLRVQVDHYNQVFSDPSYHQV
ncbi:hypothetical protein SPRG_03177 [Saprolegnia parasitica CBS 223.65]|uniref:Complex 1 LYR protein domain-containing protein n=1 Tax=Saprolegnia parasitica (strain CBS 223.65) TaxID=695850 RepID=A0A067CZK1_SAPPC|nr:hypothetical protein SPRG_03177 [Saprolegnia parasitica CBS 223.65]KDO31961.1 hypothetical protein SPRG_03177 [Saprolegnia parasitica CBS 223.65]|eukprot:XP_012197157.1 hypothetical protein SPRG_03177 [Saprolegnia parasitica CBS 223.65]